MNAGFIGGVLIAVALGACGKGDNAKGSGASNSSGDELPRQGACDARGKTNMCIEYFGQPGSTAGITASGRSNCEQAGGTVVDTCPKAGALGRCTSAEIRIQQTLMYVPLTKERAELICKGMGDGKLGPP